MIDLMMDLDDKINEAEKYKEENPNEYKYLLKLKKSINIMISVGGKTSTFESLLKDKENVYNEPILEIVAPYFEHLEFLDELDEKYYTKEEVYKYLDKKIDEYEKLGKYNGIKNNKL